MFAGLATMLVSCNPNQIYREFHELKGFQWERGQVQTFDVAIEDAAKSYDVIFGYRYTMGFSDQAIRFKMDITGPSGFNQLQEYSVGIMDEKGDYIGEPSLDIWDIETKIIEGIKFPEAGQYSFSISHTMPSDEVYFTMEVGLLLEKKGD